MSIYRYDNSPIREVAFHHARNRPPVAFLKAAQGISAEQLSAIRAMLDSAGWESSPVYIEKQPVLQVSGFKQEPELNSLLRTNGYTGNEISVTRDAEDEQRTSFRERARGMSLRLTGALNILGDVVLAIGGHNKGDGYRTAGGSLLTLGSLNLLRYGNAKSAHYVQEVSDDLKAFIRSEGSEAQSGPKATFTKAENFLYRHPAQVTFGINTLGATSNLISGIRDFHNKEGWGGLGFGIGSVGLKLAALLIPEKSEEDIAQDKTKHRNVLRKAIDWIQEKPLRFYGSASLLTDLFLGVRAYNEFRENPKKWGVYASTALGGLAYSLADLTVAMSSKEHAHEEGGKFTADEQRAIEAIAAESLAQQPEPARGAMAQKIGSFLTRRKEMRGNSESIAQSIIQQAKQLKENPWASRNAQEPSPAAASR